MKNRTSRLSEIKYRSDHFQHRGALACSIAFLFLLIPCSCGANEDSDGIPVVLAATGGGPQDPSSARTIKRSDLCAGCHEDHHELWREGGHSMISCTRCHGFVKEHTLEEVDPRPEMELHGDAELCLSCHGEDEKNQRIKAPKIKGIEEHVALVSEKHSVRIDLERTEGECIFCHDPHSLE